MACKLVLLWNCIHYIEGTGAVVPVLLRIIHNHQRNCDKIGSISDWNISAFRVITQYNRS